MAIVGAGVAGAALASGLGGYGRRTVVIERDLREPQLFVGELLQPGGVEALRALRLTEAVEGIDAQPVRGFAVVHGSVSQALSYPPRPGSGADASPARGHAFHHGRFVGRLREAAGRLPAVEIREGTATALEQRGGRVVGVRYRDKRGAEHLVRAKLTVACDGRNSRLRRTLGNSGGPQRKSYSLGVLMRGARLPFPGHGNVFVAEPSPMLGYQIGSDEVRLLVDIPGELPRGGSAALAAYARRVVEPQLPEGLRGPFSLAVGRSRLRVMPANVLAPAPRRAPGAVLVGDALNMRHPITGSGMTVALHDARLLTELLSASLMDDPAWIDRQVRTFYSARRPLALTIDMLAGALYDVLRADGPGLERMRDAMLRYWKLGGVAAAGPMSLLSGLSPRPSLLLIHYLAVALVGVGQQLTSRSRQLPLLPSPDLRGASQLALAAFDTIRPQLRRALELPA